MLPKSQRIPRKLFGLVIEKGKFSHSTHFSLRTAPTKELRVAVSVSKKVAKKATDRNRIRRRAYSALRVIIPSLHSGFYFLSAKPGSGEVKGRELEQELRSLVK